MVVLQLFNREKRAYKQFADINCQHMEAFKDAILAYAIYYPVVEVLSTLAIALVVWFGGNWALKQSGLELHMQTVTVGIVTAFIQYAQRFFRPIQDLSEKYNILQSAMASSERVFKLLDSPVEIVSPANPVKAEGRAASSLIMCGSPIASWIRRKRKRRSFQPQPTAMAQTWWKPAR